MPHTNVARLLLVVLAALMVLAVLAGTVPPGNKSFSSSIRGVERVKGSEVPAAVKAQVQAIYGKLPSADRILGSSKPGDRFAVG